MTSRRHISRGRKEGCRVKRLQLSLLILMACWSTHTHTHTSTRANSTHTYKYGVNEEALDVCIKTLGLASHTLARGYTENRALSRAHTKYAGNEERKLWMYI